ncbi:uncharacterized protein LOC106158494 [Lingula anatina]|uniref:Uncharacterized protein LOC106158494 n=1 Tax=Lingula anatina TaxID=7574 RepID=A0A1S3HVC1_LINAN|nr:uncharacterized protein LOC106158494 [Lingula anatina]|eukprot:XP_013389968.1 uncharacterized protein LOC106158494 [Lingula anatina]
MSDLSHVNVQKSLPAVFIVLAVLTFPSYNTVLGTQECSSINWYHWNRTYSADFRDSAQCCAQSIDNWLGLFRLQEYQQRDKTLSYIVFENRTFWDRICRQWLASARCVQALQPKCSVQWGSQFLRNRSHSPTAFRVLTHGQYAFYDRTCDGDRVSPAVTKLCFHKDVRRSCLTNTEAERFKNCTGLTMTEIYNTPGNFYQVYMENKERWDGLARAALRCMRDVIKSSSCAQHSQDFFWHLAKLQLPALFNVSVLNIEESVKDSPEVNFADLKRCTVGVYGDPHLRLCEQRRLVTCSAPGRQVFLSNQFVEIQGSNELVNQSHDSRATTLKWLRITMKSYDGKTMLATYTASGGKLPETFDDGSRTVLGQGKDKIMLMTGFVTRVVISQYAVGVVYMVRHWKGNYFFSVRMAENMVWESFGLLSTGCPKQEFIGLDKWIGHWKNGLTRYGPSRVRRQIRVTKCTDACKDIKDEDFQRACKFDCIVTDDPQISTMTRVGVTDVREIVKSDPEAIKMAVKIHSSGRSSKSSTLWILMLFVISFNTL